MGPGCPVCMTDVPEVDEGVVLARQGVRVATFGDMLRVPGTVQSLADAQASGAAIDIVYTRARPRTLRARRTKKWSSSRRIRDHRRRYGRGDPQRSAAELLRPLRAQIYPAGDGDRGRNARFARGRIPRCRPRRDDHRLRRLRTVRGAPLCSRRRGRFRADRHPGRTGRTARPDPQRHTARGQHVSALCKRGRQSRRTEATVADPRRRFQRAARDGDQERRRRRARRTFRSDHERRARGRRAPRHRSAAAASVTSPSPRSWPSWRSSPASA